MPPTCRVHALPKDRLSVLRDSSGPRQVQGRRCLRTAAYGELFRAAQLATFSARTEQIVRVKMPTRRGTEEVVLSFPSGGAGRDAVSDLAGTTTLAAAAGDGAFYAELDLTWRGPPAPTQPQRILQARSALAAPVQADLDGAYAKAPRRVASHRPALEALAMDLLQGRFLIGVEAEGIPGRQKEEGGR